MTFYFRFNCIFYSYNGSNQLIKSVTEEAVINNTYNAAGYRVAKCVTKDGNTTKTYFLYDGNHVIMEADENGVIAKNTYGGPLLLRTVFGDTEETYQYLYNAHGDVVTLISDGEVAATYYYDSFGNILEQIGNVDNSILYAGYQYDEETGLYYINARMYDPVTARFLQADTYLGNANDPLSLNLYTYCLNNPHKYTDPSGHSVLLACLLVAVASFALGAGMEYVSQKYIEKRDVINYDLILYEGVFNALIGIASMGLASAGVTALRQAGKVTVRTVTRTIATNVALGVAEGAIENVGRQMVTGTSLTDLDYGEVASSAAVSGMASGIGTMAGIGLDALKQARVMRKLTDGANVLGDSNIDRVLTGADVDVPVEGMAYQSGSKTVPESLLQGDANTRVYVGIKDGKPDYVGISYDIERRQSQHGERFDYLRELTTEPLTRRQARAIEQVMINSNPKFSNKINSISTKRDWYNDAITWGDTWLKQHGYLK